MKKKFTLFGASLAVSTVMLSTSVMANPFWGYQARDMTNPFMLVANEIQNKKVNWLGVNLSPVPIALRDQLSDLIPKGQGVLVASVGESSSAAEAGIGRNDVLLSYDDQKLYSPEQLSGLIRDDLSGRQVAFQVVQKGKLKTIMVKLGSRELPVQQPGARPMYPYWQYQPRTTQPYWNKPPQANVAPNSSNNPGSQALAWDSFESVQVNTLPDGRYHAEISFKNKSNETKKFTFEGKREEIISQINSQSDLPDDKKKALLNALNMRSGGGLGLPFNQPFPRGNPFNSPFFQRDPFDDPFFRNNPFDDPFFQRFFQYRQPSPQVPRINEPLIKEGSGEII